MNYLPLFAADGGVQGREGAALQPRAAGTEGLHPLPDLAASDQRRSGKEEAAPFMLTFHMHARTSILLPFSQEISYSVPNAKEVKTEKREWGKTGMALLLLQALAKCTGWAVLSSSSNLGCGPVEPLSNATGCLLSSPNGDRSVHAVLVVRHFLQIYRWLLGCCSSFHAAQAKSINLGQRFSQLIYSTEISPQNVN